MGLLSGITAGLGILNPVGLIGSLGATALSGGLDYLGQQDTNKTNAAIAAQTNAQASADTQATNAENLNIASQADQMQYDFAQNGISWRIADAAKNGISPLAALGAAEPSASPAIPVMQSPNIVTPSYSSPYSALGQGIGAMGQNLSSALSATRSPEQKASDALDLAYKSKQNDLLDLQIRNAQLSLANRSYGIPAAYTQMMNADGTTSTVPSPEAAQAAHGQFLGPMLWSLDNKLIPGFQDFGNHVLDISPSSYPQGGTSSGLD